MATWKITVTCPHCGSEDVTKQGRKNGKQTYLCKNPDCPKKYFTELYTNKGCDPDVRKQVLMMTANGNGTRGHSKGSWNLDKHSHRCLEKAGKPSIAGKLPLYPGTSGRHPGSRHRLF